MIDLFILVSLLKSHLSLRTISLGIVTFCALVLLSGEIAYHIAKRYCSIAGNNTEKDLRTNN